MIEIDLNTAKSWAQSWQSTEAIKAFLFHRNEINCVESVTGAVGIRFYMGLKENGNMDMIVVGVNPNGEDIINDRIGANSLAYNFAFPCPALCDTDSALYFGPEAISPQAPPAVDESADCVEVLQEITYQQARARTFAWQNNYAVKCAFFTIQDLNTALEQLGDADTLRVYFGIDDSGAMKLMLVKVDLVNNIYRDVLTPGSKIVVNGTPVCVDNQVSCSVDSPLYYS